MAETGSRTIYVISDLHLGGVYGKKPKARGFRINTHVADLVEFVNSIAAGPQTELVINGDMVDFLAERVETSPSWSDFNFDPNVACAKLQAIADRDRPFFDALRAFLDKGHRLTILLGNHDIELALPAVRRKLKEVIGVQVGHDYELIHNGEAYSVGDALIEHGNRYDPWNTVDHDGLRQICSLHSRGQSHEKASFDPPAGSKMVARVINPIKEDYKFIDLLKPETDVAVPLLLALEPGYRSALMEVIPLKKQTLSHGMDKDADPVFGGDIHAGGSDTSEAFGSDISAGGDFGAPAQASNPDVDPEAALQKILADRLPGGAADFERRLEPAAGSTESDIGSDISTASFIDRTMGMIGLLKSKDDQDVGRRMPALLRSLQALQPDRSFDLDNETDPNYTTAARKRLEGGFHYVLFGHTHMPKKIELSPGCWYLNSGCWADLMRLPPDIITAKPEDARKALDPFVLDMAADQLERWIIFNPTYIQLELDQDNRVVKADLMTFRRAAAAGS